MDDSTVPRRKVLRSCGLAGGILVAGCSSGGDGDGGSSDGGDGGSSDGGDGSGGDGGDGSGGDGGDGGSGDPLENVQEPGNCEPSYDDTNPSCAELSNALDSLVQFDGAGTESVVNFAYPCGWGSIDPDPEFDPAYNLLNVGTGIRPEDTDEFVSLDIQVRTYYEPVGEDFIDQRLEDQGGSIYEYEYDGETRRAMFWDIASEEFAGTAETSVPHPETGDPIRIDFVGTLHGGACLSESEAVIEVLLDSMEPNPDTTHSPQ